MIDRVIIMIFTIEIAVKIAVYRLSFFRNGWNLFDFVIVAISLAPPGGESMSALRALRVLRVLRLVSIMPQLRSVVEALIRAVPGMGAVLAVLGLLFYVGAVVSTRLFGEAFPEWFGTLGSSAFTLFQVMTLESWSMGIVRPVMDEFSWAWAFFVPFIVMTSFAVLNLFIAIIVNAMQGAHDEEAREIAGEAERHVDEQFDALRQDLAAIREQLDDLRRKDGP